MPVNLPLDTDLLLERLKAAVPELRSVGDAISFDAIKDLRTIQNNCAFVVLDNEKNSADTVRQTNQTFARFGVVVAARNARPDQLIKDARQLIGSVRDALVNWRPPGREFQACIWLGGEVMDYDQNVLLWVDMYQTNYFTNGV